MASKKATVCLIDDESDIIESFSACLALDYEVRTFTSAKVALGEFDRGLQPEVIITDLRMPEMDGLSFLAELRKRNSTSSLLVISGHAGKSDVIQAANFGISGFIEKPFTMRELREALIPFASRPNQAAVFSEILKETNNLVRDLEDLNESHFERAVMAENYIVKMTDSLYSSAKEKLEFLQFLREQRSIERKNQATKKNIQEKIERIRAGR